MIYWAMLHANDEWQKTWFKDGFTDGKHFEEDYKYLFKPKAPAKGATLVFYPHGNLFLATDFMGDEIKVSSDEDNLLETVSSIWSNEDAEIIPLLVSEGETKEKLSIIRQSDYLNIVYYDALSKLDKSLVIYGWSMSSQDNHILDAIAKGSLDEIAISVHTEAKDWQFKCEEVERKIRRQKGLTRCNINFFDADSSGCWIHQ